MPYHRQPTGVLLASNAVPHEKARLSFDKFDPLPLPVQSILFIHVLGQGQEVNVPLEYLCAAVVLTAREGSTGRRGA